MALAPRDRIALIVLVAVVIGAGAFFLLTRGGGGEEPAPTQEISSPAPTTDEQPPSEPEEEEKQGRPRPKRFSFFAGRDPFVPLVVAQAGGGGQGTTPPGQQPTGGTTPPQQQPRETATVGGRQIVLIDIIQGPKAQVEVDGKSFVVAEGETFAQNFMLVSIQGGCANFLFGDQSFTLCEPGERK